MFHYDQTPVWGKLAIVSLVMAVATSHSLLEVYAAPASIAALDSSLDDSVGLDQVISVVDAIVDPIIDPIVDDESADADDEGEYIDLAFDPEELKVNGQSLPPINRPKFLDMPSRSNSWSGFKTIKAHWLGGSDESPSEGRDSEGSSYFTLRRPKIPYDALRRPLEQFSPRTRYTKLIKKTVSKYLPSYPSALESSEGSEDDSSRRSSHFSAADTSGAATTPEGVDSPHGKTEFVNNAERRLSEASFAIIDEEQPPHIREEPMNIEENPFVTSDEPFVFRIPISIPKKATHVIPVRAPRPLKVMVAFREFDFNKGRATPLEDDDIGPTVKTDFNFTEKEKEIMLDLLEGMREIGCSVPNNLESQETIPLVGVNIDDADEAILKVNFGLEVALRRLPKEKEALITLPLVTQVMRITLRSAFDDVRDYWGVHNNVLNPHEYYSDHDFF